MRMEIALVVILLGGLLIPATLIFWAMNRSTSLTRRLHPLTPEERRRKRKAYVILTPIMVAGIILGAVIGSGGQGAIVAIAIFATIVLSDSLLTPWLYYRRARRQRKSHARS